MAVNRGRVQKVPALLSNFRYLKLHSSNNQEHIVTVTFSLHLSGNISMCQSFVHVTSSFHCIVFFSTQTWRCFSTLPVSQRRYRVGWHFLHPKSQPMPTNSKKKPAEKEGSKVKFILGIIYKFSIYISFFY